MKQFKIFIVEDNNLYANLLQHNLALNPDFDVEIFATGKDCLSNLYKMPSLITVDYSLDDMTGTDLLKKIHAQNPDIPVIIISGQEDVTTAIELLKEGAVDYLVKNEDTIPRLWNSMRLIREKLALLEENDKLREEIGKKYDFSNIIIGNSPVIKDVFRLLEKASASTITVSITGETGTGKELAAKAIHYHSVRKKKPFIALNVAAIPRELIESELFGHEKGAFTGAIARKTGVFEQAHQGTIFLDEIAEMDMSTQTKFLRVLQEKEIKRIGGNELIKVDARIITATHKNLAEEVKKGNFRSDLYFRLMGLPIHMPPLRERGNDIIKLAKHYANDFCKENKKHNLAFSEDATKKLLWYPYPGNVRELRAVIELAVVFCEGDKINSDHINFAPVDSIDEFYNDEHSLESYIHKIVLRYMHKYDNNPTVVAKKLGISRATVYRYIKENRKTNSGVDRQEHP
ncbi:MAG: regulator [Bacteroidetes bacterium HGW-Bacteroidetes-11]|jgi:DNA-binding NtrC family response regulator|nr:MAG: regulator [Bacteroidetes bacterium HGW-Bacteroidetes-11]